MVPVQPRKRWRLVVFGAPVEQADAAFHVSSRPWKGLPSTRSPVRPRSPALEVPRTWRFVASRLARSGAVWCRFVPRRASPAPAPRRAGAAGRVRVAERHRECLVSHQLLDGAQADARRRAGWRRCAAGLRGFGVIYTILACPHVRWGQNAPASMSGRGTIPRLAWDISAAIGRLALRLLAFGQMSPPSAKARRCSDGAKCPRHLVMILP